MENWQLALVILASVLVGALIPVLVMAALAIRQASRDIHQIGQRLAPTLDSIQRISERVETLSQGLEGGERNIAQLLQVLGEVSATLQRNIKVVNIASAVMAAAGPAVAAFVSSLRKDDETGLTPVPEGNPAPVDHNKEDADE